MLRSIGKQSGEFVEYPKKKGRPRREGFAEKEGFYRAMLCIRGTSHGPVSVSARLSVRL